MQQRDRGGRARARTGGVAVVWALAACLLAGAVHAQDAGWELRVCADPDAFPFSSRDEGPGFENRIAEILADELGATLTYDWYPQTPDLITFHLREGTCDLIMGVPDGVGGLLDTVAYYRSPYVFVYRADAPFEVESLDDPVLRELRIAVQNFGIPPHEALVDRGLSDNIDVRSTAGMIGAGYDPDDWTIEAVADGTADVGIAWGPVAGYYARQQDVELTLVPVTPEFVPPATFMSFPMVIGVRPGDSALRDRLDIALARRWDDIQAVLDEYAVPRSQIAAPVAPAEAGDDALRFGLVVPSQSGSMVIQASVNDLVGEAAVAGALLAEDDVGNEASGDGVDFDLLVASSPSAEAAVRAAERMIDTDGVDVLIGGLGEGQAEALAAVARERDVLFLNVGSTLDALRQRCEPTTFHVEASGAMYVDALVSWYAEQGARAWFVVRETGEEGDALARRADEAVARFGGEVAGVASVEPELASYFSVFDQVRDAGADTILLLLDGPDQIAFLGQLDLAGLDAAVAPFPHPLTQTRDYIAAARFQSEVAGRTDRVALWETTLDTPAAAELNERFTARWGIPLDPSGWAAYEAVVIAYRAARAAGSDDAEALAAYLESPDATFETAKGETPLSFRPSTHQLRQPLYVIRPDPEVEYRRRLSTEVALAGLVGQLPDDATAAGADAGDANARLDLLGDVSDAGGCTP